jgi:hypothetical protein
MNTTESLKDYQRVRTLAIRSLFEIIRAVERRHGDRRSRCKHRLDERALRTPLLALIRPLVRLANPAKA